MCEDIYKTLIVFFTILLLTKPSSMKDVYKTLIVFFTILLLRSQYKPAKCVKICIHKCMECYMYLLLQKNNNQNPFENSLILTLIMALKKLNNQWIYFAPGL